MSAPNQGRSFHPPPPGRHMELEERRPAKRDRRDAAASMFWSFVSSIEGRAETLEERYLQLIRGMGELKRRLDVAEESLSLYRQLFGDGKPAIKFFCIACDHEFNLPLDEAEAENFTTTCPKCHAWCLPYPEHVQRQYTAKEIAAMCGFSYCHVAHIISRHGFNDNTPGRHYRLYTAEQTKQIIEIVKGKQSMEEIEVPLSAELRARIEAAAKRNHRSVNTEIIRRLRLGLARREKELRRGRESATI
jgi:hypothetical protein